MVVHSTIPPDFRILKATAHGEDTLAEPKNEITKLLLSTFLRIEWTAVYALSTEFNPTDIMNMSSSNISPTLNNEPFVYICDSMRYSTFGLIKLSKDWGQKRGAITEVLTPLSFFTEKTNTKKN